MQVASFHKKGVCSRCELFMKALIFLTVLQVNNRHILTIILEETWRCLCSQIIVRKYTVLT